MCQVYFGNYQTNFTIYLETQSNKNSLGSRWIKFKKKIAGAFL